LRVFPHLRLLPPPPAVHDGVRQRLRPVVCGRDRRPPARRAPGRRGSVRVRDRRGAARAPRDDSPGPPAAARRRPPRRVRPGVPFPALAHRRGGARARRDDARGVPRGARVRRRERQLSAHGRGPGSRRPPRRRPAENLRAAAPIRSDLGVDTSWEITGGDSPYYATARALQATLEGAERVLSDEGLARWVEVNRVNAKKLTLDADLVLVHDVQPASLVTHRTDGRWVWRCHFDCSAARPAAWSFFR